MNSDMKDLDPVRLQMLYEYMTLLHAEPGMDYATRGRYADSVFLFLRETQQVSRRGYKAYIKANARLAIDKPWTKKALCHFLASRGMGFRRLKEKPKREIKAMEIREVRHQQVINDFALWLQNENDFSDETNKNYIRTARLLFSYCDEFSQDNARRFIATLEAEGKKPATINLRICGLKKLSEYLKKPVKLKRLKIPKTLFLENVPSEKEYQTLLSWLDQHNPRWAYIIRLMGTTGARASELLQFTYEMVEAGHCMLKGKGAKYRQFFFTKEIREGAKGKRGLIVINQKGQPMTTRGLDARLKTFAEKAGLPRQKLHAHAFRHFFAKMYLKKTKDVVALADLLGHGSVDITRIYLQKTQEEQKRDFNRFVSW